LGSKDLIKPKAIIENVNTFGMIKCFKSIKNIMMKDKFKIISNTVVRVMPYK